MFHKVPRNVFHGQKLNVPYLSLEWNSQWLRNSVAPKQVNWLAKVSRASSVLKLISVVEDAESFEEEAEFLALTLIEKL